MNNDSSPSIWPQIAELKIKAGFKKTKEERKIEILSLKCCDDSL